MGDGRCRTGFQDLTSSSIHFQSGEGGMCVRTPRQFDEDKDPGQPEPPLCYSIGLAVFPRTLCEHLMLSDRSFSSRRERKGASSQSARAVHGQIGPVAYVPCFENHGAGRDRKFLPTHYSRSLSYVAMAATFSFALSKPHSTVEERFASSFCGLVKSALFTIIRKMFPESASEYAYLPSTAHRRFAMLPLAPSHG